MARISPSQLDRRITIQRAITRDDHGDSIEDLQDLCTVPARMRTVKGAEIITNDAPLAFRDVQFAIRYSSQVAQLTPADSIKYTDQGNRSQIYDIADITEIGRRQWLVITARLRDAVNG